MSEEVKAVDPKDPEELIEITVFPKHIKSDVYDFYSYTGYVTLQKDQIYKVKRCKSCRTELPEVASTIYVKRKNLAVGKEQFIGKNSTIGEKFVLWIKNGYELGEPLADDPDDLPF